MSKMTFNITGLPQFRDKLSRLSREMEDRIGRKATGTMAVKVRNEAREIAYKAPKDYWIYNTVGYSENGSPNKIGTRVKPGHISRNIIMKYIPRAERRGLASEHIVTVSMSQDGPYGARNIATLVEYGINMDRPHPFMRPAFDHQKANAFRAAENVIARELRQIWNQ